MKRIGIRLSAVLLSVMVVTASIFITACAGEGLSEGSKTPRWNTEEFVAQNASAENTYKSIYREVSNGASEKSVQTSSMQLAEESYDGGSDGLDAVLALLDKYRAETVNVASMINSYIGDIFSYSQIQLSLIEEYESEALAGTYDIDYSNVEWTYEPEDGETYDMDFQLLLAFLERTKPFVAKFIGVDPITDKAYIEQTHKFGLSNSEAKLEYYFDKETNRMGVTTLNWHYNEETGVFNGFEYHYCDAVDNIVVTAMGSIDSDSQLFITSAAVTTEKGSYSDFFETDEKFIMDYVLSEVERIESEMIEIEQRNLEIINAADDFTVPEENRSIVVNYDFGILKSMLKSSV